MPNLGNVGGAPTSKGLPAVSNTSAQGRSFANGADGHVVRSNYGDPNRSFQLLLAEPLVNVPANASVLHLRRIAA
jgi:hypothetical protein